MKEIYMNEARYEFKLTFELRKEKYESRSHTQF